MQMLVRRGNPFFLEETVRTLVETGVLAGERGAYRLARPVETLQVPTTVQTILAARIDRLLPEEKQLLQAASVVGKDVSYALLAAIARQSEEALRRGLAHLQEAEFLYEAQLFPDLELTFKHALTCEVTYGSLLQERRQTLHAQIVMAIERLYADRLGEQVERLALHALRGHLWDKAIRYSRQAGSRALDRAALQEALANFDQAQLALQELPESPERTEQTIDVCFEQRHALSPLGELVRRAEVLGRARLLAEELGDQQRLGRALIYHSHLKSDMGEHAAAIDAGERACRVAEAIGDVSLRAVANYYLGQALLWSGEPRRATDRLRAAIQFIKGVPPSERLGLPILPGVLARWILALSLADLGEFPEARATAEEALRIAQTGSHLYSEVWARYSLGYVHLRHGDFTQATQVLEQTLALCRGAEFRVALPFATAYLGYAYLWTGRTVEAVSLLEEAVQAATTMQMRRVRSWIFTFLAEARLVVGRIAEARAQVEQSLVLARAHPQQGWDAWDLKLLGDMHAHRALNGELSGAAQSIEAYRQALELAMELGMRPLAAHCHLGLGKLHKRSGEREEARVHLATAAALYREMDMRFWLEQTDAVD
jgi:tetratricopeptide (TPR) repeat protein